MTPNLSKEDYGKIERLMVRGYHPDSLPTLAFGDIVQTLRGLYGADMTWGVTVRSAVPLADALRGFYEEAYGEAPRIIPINADMEKAWSPKEVRQQLVQDEASRLADTYAIGRGTTVAVLDQFQGNGRTAQLATEMVAGTGATAARNYPDKVRWYNNVIGSIDVGRVTSTHAEFMTHVGRRAAKLSILEGSLPVGIQQYPAQ